MKIEETRIAYGKAKKLKGIIGYIYDNETKEAILRIANCKVIKFMLDNKEYTSYSIANYKNSMGSASGCLDFEWDTDNAINGADFLLFISTEDGILDLMSCDDDLIYQGTIIYNRRQKGTLQEWKDLVSCDDISEEEVLKIII